MYITKGSQDLELKHIRNLEARADAQAMEGCYLLTCVPWLVQLCYRTSTTSRGGTTHLGLGPPPLITK